MTATASRDGRDRFGENDQGRTLPFKLTLAAQAAAGLVFGLAPLA